ncbi:MAG: enoyl-CoA hydratase/isomerase family protein [Alphaproteobacteria bacterium]|jgi:isohexenylglutaconyl-CoA hydratase|nr:enoyl-CoA hydratase/isomerase family protein [Alphaproteobacteria bacterium]MBT4965612.1 enoyl-CoA hydratase/isomerase family protein [Alphaproteobacteria bacterium]MBT5159482.1 enoyl-CoA hydratase/isomerase family protein [Alphaproteobacteria bacterium]MBT5917598.1 enoyl-CoA hydratase/isomerase family protein [Alphaproteobacteria bacterium]MBT6387060.1 enoyl-CoA hydratase/isomerase family protein [Alphaproteobacteria bacterium]
MTNLPETKNLVLDADAGWLTIWFNRPESRNALAQEMVDELVAVLRSVRDDRSVRGVTLRGKGGWFCAGGDLKSFKSDFQGGAKGKADVVAASRAAGEMFDLINEMPQVVVILVEGAAMAGGLGMVCCADVVAVTKDARFALTETTLGIPPAQIAPFVVQRLGLRTARRLMLTASRFKGVEAGELGLADYVVDDADGLEAIEKEVKNQVMRCAPGANAITKKIVLATRKLDRNQMLEMAANGFADCMLSDEGREGVASFLEKRKPQWAS